MTSLRKTWGGNKWTVWTLTFMSYAMYHVSRKIYSVIKSRLDDEDWFGENSGDTKLATLDALFLFFYAVGLYFGGSIGDRYNPRYVLSIGMTAVSFCVIIFGLCGIANVRSLWVYATIWSVNGLLQSSGWPTNVGIMGSWFKFEDRGMKMGLWAGNASFGNIVGTGVAAILLYEMSDSAGWQWSMIVAGIMVLATALLLYCFLVPSPKELIEDKDYHELAIPLKEEDDNHESTTNSSESEDEAIGILGALRIPGVVPYALAYACLKSTNYALFFWLPLYLVDSMNMSSTRADFVSMLFDCGQIIGAGFAGYITDRMGQRSPITFAFICIATGFLALMEPDWVNPSTNIVMLLLFATGFFMGGPTNLISGCISADLGSHESIKGNKRAMSTVAGIIDGTGSLGAAIVQYLVGYLKDQTCHCVKKHPNDPNNDDEICTHWQWIFVMLIICNIGAALLISPIVKREWRQYKNSS